MLDGYLRCRADCFAPLPVLVGVTAFALTWTLVGLQAHNYKANPQGTPADAFLWGERFFNAQKDFAYCLHQRGASYAHWAKHHHKTSRSWKAVSIRRVQQHVNMADGDMA